MRRTKPPKNRKSNLIPFRANRAKEQEKLNIGEKRKKQQTHNKAASLKNEVRKKEEELNLLHRIKELEKELKDYHEKLGKAAIGCPPTYHPEMDIVAYRMTLLGATNKDLCELFGVHEGTILGWRARYPSFDRAVREGKGIADSKVGESLFQRATGYSHPEEKVFLYQGQVIKVETTKHYPPDPTSMVFWLKNRRPDLWREKPEEPTSVDDLVEAVGDLIAKLPN